MAKIDHDSIGSVLEHVYLTATITAVDGSNDTVSFTGIGECSDGVDIPLFYHGAPDSVLRDNGALEGAAGAFSVDDAVIVQCEIESAEHYKPLRVIGFIDKPKACARPYIYATISDYVTIWDLEIGEIAENINDVDGNVITFPCHKDKLEKWLEKVKDRPTRQVLKDNPVDNRDFLDDNEMDTGNENRTNDTTEPEDVFGLPVSPAFTNIVRDDIVNECGGATFPPYGTVCKWYHVLEKDSPVDFPEYTDSWIIEPCAGEFNPSPGPYSDPNPLWNHWQRGGFCNCTNGYDYDRKGLSCNAPWPARYLEECDVSSRYLKLQPYSTALYGYSGEETVKMIEALTSYRYTFQKTEFGWAGDPMSDQPVFRFWKESTFYVNSYKTPLGNLTIDLIPIRELRKVFSDIDNYKRLHETLHSEVSEFENVEDFSANILEKHSTDFKEYLEQAPGDTQWYEMDHSPNLYTKDCEVTSQSFGATGESDRYGISWCELPEKRFGETPWYKIKLLFNTVRAYQYKTVGHEEHPTTFPDITCVGEDSEGYLDGRISSVQATIELESPANYPKKKNSEKYSRPSDYDNLCVFPDRECGYAEEEDSCYPFDGTYDIYTLGEAVEKLINNHYEDGSDDQLLVYCLNH